MKLFATTALRAATITTGLIAGLFAGFAYAVMPGLRRGDDRTFVDAMQQINKAILNGWFLSCFLGAFVALGVAAVCYGRSGDRSPCAGGQGQQRWPSMAGGRRPAG